MVKLRALGLEVGDTLSMSFHLQAEMVEP